MYLQFDYNLNLKKIAAKLKTSIADPGPWVHRVVLSVWARLSGIGHSHGCDFQNQAKTFVLPAISAFAFLGTMDAILHRPERAMLTGQACKVFS